MAINIKGVTYYSVTDIHQDLDVTRQTLWRWRKDGKIPQGLRYRGHQIVFTKQEAEAIREYANRLEPAELSNSDKVKVLSANSSKRSK